MKDYLEGPDYDDVDNTLLLALLLLVAFAVGFLIGLAVFY